MIATIVCSIVIVLLIIFTIIASKKCDFFFTGLNIGSIFATIVLLIVSLGFGQQPKHSLNKQTIEYLLETDLCKENLTLAENYNEEEHRGNNYWCRFKLRDEDLINIDYYINKKIGTDK